MYIQFQQFSPKTRLVGLHLPIKNKQKHVSSQNTVVRRRPDGDFKPAWMLHPLVSWPILSTYTLLYIFKFEALNKAAIGNCRLIW